MAEKTCGIDFLAGFMVGALVGAAAALLFAPQAGEETRLLIRDKGIELKEQAGELSSEARRRAEELQAQARKRTEKLQTRVKEAIEEGKTAATTKKEELLSQLDESQTAVDTLVEGEVTRTE